jgi:hypothetical protein
MLQNVAVRRAFKGRSVRMFIEQQPPLAFLMMPDMLAALCAKGIADEVFDTARASLFARMDDEETWLSLLKSATGTPEAYSSVFVADIELDLECVQYTGSAAAVTMDGPVHLAQWKLASAATSHITQPRNNPFQIGKDGKLKSTH